MKEYLVSERIRASSVKQYHLTSDSSNITVTKICLGYLLHLVSIELTDPYLNEYPLWQYATGFWSQHYRSIINSQSDQSVDLLGYELITSGSYSSYTWLRFCNQDVISLRRLLWIPEEEIDHHYRFSILYNMSLLGCSGLVQMLIDKGADVDVEGGHFGTALVAASFMDYDHIVKLLLHHGASAKVESALWIASYRGHEKVVQLLLGHGVGLNWAIGEGDFEIPFQTSSSTAFQAASACGHERVVQLLIDHGADVEAKWKYHGTALIAASSGGHAQVVRLLIENGADVNAHSGKYGNALIAASFGGHTQVVRLLIENGADVNAHSGKYGNALIAASFGGHTQVVRLLIENGADVNTLENTVAYW